MNTIRDFLSLYRLYRVKHSRAYALKRAYGIAFTNEPF